MTHHRETLIAVARWVLRRPRVRGENGGVYVAPVPINAEGGIPRGVADEAVREDRRTTPPWYNRDASFAENVRACRYWRASHGHYDGLGYWQEGDPVDPEHYRPGAQTFTI